MINNAIDVEIYFYNQNTRNRLRNELGIADDEFIVGNMGKLEYQKNQTCLIKEFKEMFKQNRIGKLTIIT